jgi:hypothetical protein
MHNHKAFVDETERSGFNATLDIHSSVCEHILDVRPDVKVILLTRDYDSWCQQRSMEHITLNVNVLLQRFPLNIIMSDAVTVIEHAWANWLDSGDEIDRCGNGMTCMPGSDKHRAALRQVYDNVHSRVSERVPPEQLIVLNLGAGDGYAKLCAGLGVPASRCPDGPFPRINSRPKRRDRLDARGSEGRSNRHLRHDDVCRCRGGAALPSDSACAACGPGATYFPNPKRREICSVPLTGQDDLFECYSYHIITPNPNPKLTACL